uniref:EGF-like domain-containing protein n=1 Tax=Trichobilharzia regenti TaxID=157069 RepID=A0AA85IWD0_TRIRE|nr:unnamed protein product [Trichobilharzia regenti]
MTKTHQLLISFLFINLFILLLLFNVQCLSTSELLTHTNRYKKSFKMIHYLIRQCAPYCFNSGQLAKPDMPWKKCYCLCPTGYYGVACEFNEELDHSNNLLPHIQTIKYNLLPIASSNNNQRQGQPPQPQQHQQVSLESSAINNDQDNVEERLIILK